MSGNVSRRSGGSIRNVTFSPFLPLNPGELARQRNRRPSPLRVQFAEFDLPDTPANNLIQRPVTRRWVPSGGPTDNTGEDEEQSGEEDSDSDSEADSEVSELEMDQNDAGVPQRSGSANASRAHHSSGTSPNSRAATMARRNAIRRSPPAQLTRNPSALSTRRSSLGLRGNHIQSRGDNVSPMGFTPNRASPLSLGFRTASSGSSGRAAELARSGNRHVEGDLPDDDDDDDDEDANASPSQRASLSAGQRFGSSRRIGQPSSTVGFSSTGPLSNPAGASRYQSASRLSRPAGLARQLVSTAPRAVFPAARAAALTAAQGRQSEGQTPFVQGGQAGGQIRGSHAPGGRVQGGRLEGAQTQSARVPGESTRTPDVGNHSGNMRGDVTGPPSQQASEKRDPNPMNGSGNKMVRQPLPGMSADQPQANRDPNAGMERPFLPVDFNPHQFEQRPMIGPGAQYGLPAWCPPQPAPPFHGMSPMEMQYGMLQPQQMQHLYPYGMQNSVAMNQPRAVGSSPTGLARPAVAPGSGPSAVLRPNTNAMLQAQQQQAPANAGPVPTALSSSRGMSTAPVGGPSTCSQPPTFDSLFRPRAVANTGRTAPQAGAANNTGGVSSSSNTAQGAQTPLRPQRAIKREEPKPTAGTKRSAASCKDGMRKPDHNHDDSDTDDDNDALATFSRFKKQRLDNPANNGGQASKGRNSSASKPRETGSQSKGKSVAARLSQGSSSTAPKASVQQAIRATVGGRSSVQRQNQAAAVVPGVEADRTKARQAGSGLAVFRQRQSQEQSVNSHDLQCSSAIQPADKHGALKIGCKRPATKSPPKDPSIPMGTDFFTRIPSQVRLRIYRELLKAKKSITVLNGWSQAKPGQQLELHASILGVSKKHNEVANIVLYGENTFRYVLRDNAQLVNFEVGKSSKDERTLPLKKQIVNLRYLVLEVEPDRIDFTTSMAFYTALDVLSVNGATKLFRLTIDLSPRVQKGGPGTQTKKDWISQRAWLGKNQGAIGMFKQLRPHFVSFDIHLEETDSYMAARLRTVVDMRPEITDAEVLAQLRTHSEAFKRAMDAEARRAFARDRVEEQHEAAAYKKLDMISTRIEQAVTKGGPHMLHRGWFEEIKADAR